jgi:hypothetical protein
MTASKAQMARGCQQQHPAKECARRQLRELAHDQFEIAFNQGEVCSRLIRLYQR